MTRRLRLSPDVALSADLVTESVAVLAMKRVGKSYTVRKLAEQLYHADQQTIVVDPKGDWWGIRSAADGKRPGLPFIIIGGHHQDVPIEVGSGELVAQMIVEERASVVLDISAFRPEEVPEFMTPFLETLYRLKGEEKYRTPVMLIVDEADVVAPQVPAKGEQRMLRAADTIVRRGGQRGLGITLITQRTAVISKNVLTQCGVLFLLRTTGSQDLDAIDLWIKKHGQPNRRGKVMDSISSLPVGTAWIWAPGWPDDNGIFKRVVIDDIETFDSMRTPSASERKRIAPKTFADVDLDSFRVKMAATIERAEQSDPAALQRKIARLEQQVQEFTRDLEKKAKAPRIIETPVLSDKAMQEIEAFGKQLHKVAGDIVSAFGKLKFNTHGHVVGHAQGEPQAMTRPKRLDIETKANAPVLAHARDVRRHLGIAAKETATADAKGALRKGELKLLTAIAQHGCVDASMLTILTGYKRSSRDTYLGKLYARGLAQKTNNGIEPTREGVAALGADFETLPVGSELRAYWLARLPLGERKLFEIILECYPDKIDRETLSERADYKRSSRDTYLGKLATRRLIVSDREGVKAAKELFEELFD